MTDAFFSDPREGCLARGQRASAPVTPIQLSYPRPFGLVQRLCTIGPEFPVIKRPRANSNVMAVDVGEF